MAIAAVDPGREKCGLAVLAEDGSVISQQVIATARLEREVAAAAAASDVRCLVLGNGTTSAAAEARIRKALPELPVAVVDEYRTTELAKQAYWQACPPTGWRRLLPVTMQVPPVPVDDYVAVILARRYLRGEA